MGLVGNSKVTTATTGFENTVDETFETIIGVLDSVSSLATDPDVSTLMGGNGVRTIY